ncbi:MAG: glycosyltransferase family 87 protein [Candidatus Omnitrophica bacterium]|nr:glycosyltransferase family 87 protein [Candidatus Omnitrophota bacterium]
MRKNILKILIFFLSILLAFLSSARFARAAFIAWNSFSGELLANFPFYFTLKSINPALYNSISSYPDLPWFNGGWFYGPIHHIWLFPFILISGSIQVFFRSLLIFYCASIIFIARLFYKQILSGIVSKVYPLLFTAIFFGAFALMDNLTQRNVELFELLLIIAAFIALSKKREYLGGICLCLAATAKLLPFIFLPYLIVKKRKKAVIAFLGTFLVIIFLGQLFLRWQKYLVFDFSSMAHQGIIPEASSLFGQTYLSPIRHTNSSLCGFILSFFAHIDMSKQIPQVTYLTHNFFLPNVIFIFIALSIFLVSFFFFYKTAQKGNLLYEFSLVCLVMLLVSTHVNPHYYVFTILAAVSILYFLFITGENVNFKRRQRLFTIFIYICALLLSGFLIPFTLYGKMFHLKNVVFHYFTTYNILALGTLVLWFILIRLYVYDYVQKAAIAKN